jgi:hypothetical protein
MIVQEIDEESKMVTAIWFSDSHECQEGLFPASALDRAEPRQAPKGKKAAAPAPAPAKRGKKPAAK